MSKHASARRGLTGALVAGLVAGPLALGFTAPAQADVSAKIATFPYTQNWSNAGLITVNDTWTGVTGVQGYRGDDLTAATGVDPQTLLADGSATPTNVVANTTATNNAGGVLEVEGDTIAMQGSGTADAPHVVFHLDLTGKSGTTFAFNAKDLDASADNAIQQVAVQYRVGATGAYTNLPDGFVADATTASAATQVTAKSVSLPAAADNQASVFVRVLTTNAAGNDELVGIDDISITSGSGTAALSATNPGTQTVTVNQAITPFTLAAAGGTTPYTWTSTTLPAGLTLATDGTISGTPTATGTTSVTATVTDSASTPATAGTTFDIVVNAAQAVTPIAEIQGTGATSPIPAATPVTTEGVVTGVFSGSTATNGGIYIQTGGTGGATDATPGASDGLYVFGGNAQPDGVVVGDSVRVTGPVSEFGSLTQITPAVGGVVEIAALPAVTPAAIAYPTATADREAHESELLAPTGAFTVSNVFNLTGGANAFGEIGLASGTTPLKQPTDFADAADTAAIDAINAENAGRAVALDDGSSVNYMTSPNNALPLPWISGNANPPRVGAPVTLTAPVVLDYRNNAWKFQPTLKITGNGAGTATFGTDRAQNAAPADVGGDLKISTFNVLNYFPTTGQAHVAAGGTCTYFNDRAGAPIANNSCNPDGPRGAATQESFLRQQEKIVDAINKLGASVVSLEELENSIKMIGQTDRDNAIRTLVAALNAASTPGTWAFAPSPAAADLPTPAQEDVIRTGFIYKPAAVELVGPSVVLKDEVNFDNAREPLAQAFKPVGAPASSAFGVIVNHFKSKGSACASGNDPIQGNCNADRVGQAQALRDFAASFRTARGIDDLFLVGDFNSYTQEDPMQVLYEAGYENIVSDDASDASYSFNGLAGSLDHVLGNAAAVESVTGSDIWEINANESLAYQYSRYNYHGEIYHSVSPWSSSDHNPEIVGIDAPGEPATRDIQILATNDFHGRLENNSSGTEAGAATLAGAVKQLRAANPDTVFAAAGDLVGASTFTSFIQNDKPTIDALNEAGLEVSAVGNHEFDQGYDDLINRIMAPESDANPEGGAEWQYIGANVRLRATGDPAVPASWTKDFGSVRVGFVGAVTEELPSLVSPAGIADLRVDPIVSSVNAEADKLKTDGGADVVVLLVHEGASTVALSSATDGSTAFGKIVNGVNPNIDAIVSGHTHLAYNHSIPVPAWVTEGRTVTERPVVSAGQYGSNLNKLVFTVDTATGDVVAKTQSLLALKTGQTANYPVDAATKAIVDAAVATAGPLGAVEVGKIAAPYSRAKFANGTTENRGGESTLGNLVAEIQQWATSQPESGAAEIALMNPGGLRADLVGSAATGGRTLTYKQAADVQPFANTLVNMDLTGAQLETVLEQQWQLTAAGVVPSRPFLKLGMSDGLRYTYTTSTLPTPSPSDGDATYTQGEITSITLDGEPIVPGDSYSVTVNSFLAAGGDNFRELANGTDKKDTGKIDLQAQVDYFEQVVGDTAQTPDFSQRAVGVKFPEGDNGAPAGTSISFDLSSLIMTGSVVTQPGDVVVADPKDATVTVSLGGESLGEFAVDTTIPNPAAGAASENASTDESGKASVTVDLPRNLAPGDYDLLVTGATTGTEVLVPITVEAGAPVATTVTGTAAATTQGDDATVDVTVTPAEDAGVEPTGTVTVLDGETEVATGEVVAGEVSIIVPASALELGSNVLTLSYEGDESHLPSTGSVTVEVAAGPPAPPVPLNPAVQVTHNPAKVVVDRTRAQLVVVVRRAGQPATGTVQIRVAGKTFTRRVNAGRVTVRLPRFAQVGVKTVYVKYSGNATTKARTVTHKIRVVRR